MDSICQAVHRGLPAPAKAGDHGVHLPPYQQGDRAGDGPRIRSGAAQNCWVYDCRRYLRRQESMIRSFEGSPSARWFAMDPCLRRGLRQT